MLGQLHLKPLRKAGAEMLLDFRLGFSGYDPCRQIDEIRGIFQNSAVALHCGLPLVPKMVLLVIVFERATKPCEVVRYSTKGLILELIDAMHSTSKIGCSLFHCFPLAGLMTSSLVE